MSNDALTRSEWAAARRRIVEELGDDVLADKIEDTFAYGIQPGEPTNEDLDVWAAMEVMGWARDANSFTLWLDRQSGQGVTTVDNWRPSESISQALQVAMETDHGVHVYAETVNADPAPVMQAVLSIDFKELHRGPFEPEVIARKIMLELWRRLEKGES